MLGAALGAVKVTAESSIEQETHSAILAEIDGLQALYARQGLAPLINEIERRAGQTYRGAVYSVLGPEGEAVAGNVTGFTSRVPADVEWLTFEVTTADDRETEVRARSFATTEGVQIVVGRPLFARASFERALNRSLLVGFAGALVVGLAGGLFLARQNERREIGRASCRERVSFTV